MESGISGVTYSGQSVVELISLTVITTVVMIREMVVVKLTSSSDVKCSALICIVFVMTASTLTETHEHRHTHTSTQTENVIHKVQCVWKIREKNRMRFLNDLN